MPLKSYKGRELNTNMLDCTQSNLQCSLNIPVQENEK